MIIPRIHSDAKEKDAKSPTHINPVMDSEGGPKGRVNFVENSSSEQDMPAVVQYPVRDSTTHKDMDDPMWIDTFKCFCQI